MTEENVSEPMVNEETRSGKWAKIPLYLHNFSYFWGFSLVIAGVVSFLVLYPMFRTLWIAIAPAGTPSTVALLEVFHASWLIDTVLNTVIIVGSSAVLALFAGAGFAWLNERTDARIGIVGDVLPIIPLLVPSIAFAIGWVFLASPGAGFINGAIDTVLSPLGLSYNVDISSWLGIIFLYTIHGVPYVYLIVGSAIRNIDSSLEEASRVAGAGLMKTLVKISLPAIGPALIGAGLLLVIVGFSNYSIPIIVAERGGITVISVRIFRMLNADIPPRLDQAAVMTVFVMVVILSLWLIQQRMLSRGRFVAIGGKNGNWSPVRLGKWRWLAWLLMAVYFLIAAILPLGALILVSLQPYWHAAIDVTEWSFTNYVDVYRDSFTRHAFRNSMVYAASCATIAIFIAAIISLTAKQTISRSIKAVEGLLKLPAGFSHLAIAVGFLLAFAGPPFNLGGSVWLLGMAYIVLILPEASILSTAAVSQVGRELLDASAIAGAGEGRTFRRVVMPLILPGLVAGWALVFVLVAGEVTASALLSGLGRPVIGFVILTIFESGTFPKLSALAGGFALMNVAVVAVALLIGQRSMKRR